MKILIINVLTCWIFIVQGQILVSTIAGSDSFGLKNGQGDSAWFSNPSGLTTDLHNNIYVVSEYEHVIRKITPTGNVTTFAGSGGNGYFNGSSTVAQFNLPLDICMGSSDFLYVADSENKRIRKIDTNGNVSSLTGTAYSVLNYFAPPFFKEGHIDSAVMFNPNALCYDAINNYLFVSDRENVCIVKIDLNNDTMHRYAAYPLFAGGPGQGYKDAIGDTAEFSVPMGLCVDGDGNLYVADQGNNCIRKITPDRTVSTFAGKGPDSAGFRNGSIDDALFFAPTDIKIDKYGNFYVVDQSNYCIRKIDTNNMVTTYIGKSEIGGYQDGIGDSALFNFPNRMTIDGSGNKYITDANRIRKVGIYITNDTICKGDSVTLSVSGTQELNWYKDINAVTAFHNGLMYSYLPKKSDTFYVASIEYYEDLLRSPIYVHVNSSVSFNDTLYLLEGDSLVLDAGNPGAQFIWSPIGDTTQVVTIYDTGSYSVTIMNTSGCNAINEFLVLFSTINNIKVEVNEPVNIYPNPMNDFIILSLDQTVKKAIIEVTDITGRPIFKDAINSPINQYKIDCSDIGITQPGIYFIKCTYNENKKISEKILKY